MAKNQSKKVFWQTMPTRQFAEIISSLETCKENGSTSLLICDTGVGKTYSVDKFCAKHPDHTYRITISSVYRLMDVVNELAEKIGIRYAPLNRNQAYTTKIRVDAICEKLIEIKNEGGQPILIIDEGENMEMALLKLMKGLYDLLKDHCAIVLIGTPRLINRMLNLNASGNKGRMKHSLPELYRRFKAHHKNITPINKERDFTPFYTKFNIEKSLRGLLNTLCENYGELHDYLEPALREADAKGKPLTEDFFRIMYNLPKYK